MSDDRIDLAHAAPFALGRLAVRPGTRALVRDDGTIEVLEPRVMQVLVALVRAEGAIVTRDELSRWCWEDRVVGEDAINRVISRLRRAAEGIGEGAFKIETITKVGYRLLGAGRGEATPPPAPGPAGFAIGRRGLIAGATGALVAASGIGWLATRRDRSLLAPPPARSPEIVGLMQQALIAMRQSGREPLNQAIGLYRRVVTLQPDYADGWGALAIAYAESVHGTAPNERDAVQQRARAAANRALALDPRNGFARAGRVLLLARIGNWWTQEQGLRAAIADHPDADTLLLELALLLG